MVWLPPSRTGATNIWHFQCPSCYWRASGHSNFCTVSLSPFVLARSSEPPSFHLSKPMMLIVQCERLRSIRQISSINMHLFHYDSRDKSLSRKPQQAHQQPFKWCVDAIQPRNGLWPQMEAATTEIVSKVLVSEDCPQLRITRIKFP